jgi:BlaI family transcriptional regulator, penicillinase repressor
MKMPRPDVQAGSRAHFQGPGSSLAARHSTKFFVDIYEAVRISCGAMPRSNVPKPTEGELAILRVLWAEGPSTVRQVHERLAGAREVGYTTVLKLLQIMAEKGLVRREEQGRAHLYRAARSEQQTQRQLLDDLLERAFGGSAATLVLQALSSRRASPEELAEIRRLLDRKGGLR